MTAILYSKQEDSIYYDSRLVKMGDIVTDKATKSKEVQDVKFFFAGCTADWDYLIERYFNPEIPLPSKLKLTISAIIYDKRDKKVKLAAFEDDMIFIEELDNNYAIGSGATWALAALDFDKNGYDAIDYAITKNCYCGGTIRHYKIPS